MIAVIHWTILYIFFIVLNVFGINVGRYRTKLWTNYFPKVTKPIEGQQPSLEHVNDLKRKLIEWWLFDTWEVTVGNSKINSFSLNWCPPDTEIFSKRRKIYSVCVEGLSMINLGIGIDYKLWDIPVPLWVIIIIYRMLL